MKLWLTYNIFKLDKGEGKYYVQVRQISLGTDYRYILLQGTKFVKVLS